MTSLACHDLRLLLKEIPHFTQETLLLITLQTLGLFAGFTAINIKVSGDRTYALVSVYQKPLSALYFGTGVAFRIYVISRFTLEALDRSAFFTVVGRALLAFFVRVYVITRLAVYALGVVIDFAFKTALNLARGLASCEVTIDEISGWAFLTINIAITVVLNS